MNADTHPLHRAPAARSAAEGGFTLVEIMVVIVILGLLATLVTQNIMGASDESRVTKAQTDIKTIADSVRLYYTQRGRLPESLEALAEPDENNKTWITELTEDPWGNAYQLREGNTPREFEVISYGPDGSEGTDDDLSSRAKKDN